METLMIRVLDYYNKPGYYPYMPAKLFTMLENAFLRDREYCEVPAALFAQMVDKLNIHLAELEKAAHTRNPSRLAN